jgi:hypothetical protein
LRRCASPERLYSVTPGTQTRKIQLVYVQILNYV